jgi:hypothetical protein
MRNALAAACVLSLSGCAADMVASARQDCAAFGFNPGSDSFAACVERAFTRRQQSLDLASAPPSPPRPSAAPAADQPPARRADPPGVGIGFFKSQTVQGMSRICTYERISGPYVITIGANEMCPLTAP